MLPIRLLLVLTTSASVRTSILEKASPADMEVVRIRLEEEKAKRLLLQNDVEVLMLQVEELQRKFSQISKDRITLSGNVTFVTPSIAFTASLSKETTHGSEQTVIYDNIKVNEGNCYNASTGRFRAPYHGLYLFSATVLKVTVTHVHLFVMKDNIVIGKLYSGTENFGSGSVTVVTVMSKGQEVYVKERPGYTDIMHGDDWSSFTGLLHVIYN